MEKLTSKSLIGMSYLTVSQAIKYLEHPNYMLKDSEMVIINDDAVVIHAGTLHGISQTYEISFIADGECIMQTVSLKENILIVFPKELPAQAIF